MKTKSIARFLSLAVASGLLMTMLVGCLDNDSQTKQDVSSTVSETAADTGRKDGERFEDVIILEGEEETVRYEHVRNEKIGFELDYEYESLNRMTGENYEKYVSIYDNAKKPDNYLEVTYSSEKADSTVKTVKADLSKKYDQRDRRQGKDGQGFAPDGHDYPRGRRMYRRRRPLYHRKRGGLRGEVFQNCQHPVGDQPINTPVKQNPRSFCTCLTQEDRGNV